MQLFRTEVQAAQTAQWLGSVRLQRPLSFTLVTTSAIAIACVFIAFSVWGEVNRKARLTGLLVPTLGTLNINAPQPASVAQMAVAEGQTVQAGQVLLVLVAEHNSLRNGLVDDTSERVAQQIQSRLQTLATERTLRELQTRQRQQALEDRIHTLQTEYRQATEECSLYERRVQLAQTTLSRNQQLANDGFVSAAQVQSQQENLLDANARLQSAQRSRSSVEHDLQALRGQLQDLTSQFQTDMAQLDRTQSSVEQEATENTARKSIVITAPFAGTVTALGLQAGQSVQAGQTLLTLMPTTSNSLQASVANSNINSNSKVDASAIIPIAVQAPPTKAALPANTLQAHLYAPSHTAGFVRPGQTVYLRYAAYPYQKFGLYEGHITSVSATPFAPNELPPNLAQQLLAQAGSAEALYRVTVQLESQTITAYGEQIALKPGLTLDADVLQERRKVWEWLLEPVLAVREQVRVLGSSS